MYDKRSAYSWALYDWANSAYATTVMAGFFPLFFKSYYGAEVDATLSTAQLGFANSTSSFVVILLAPLLGAIADKASLKKRFLFIFAYLGIIMSLALSFVSQGSWQIAIFVYVLANIGFMGSNVFYDGLLPSVSDDEKVDFVSGLGFALGYLGGGILFSLNVWMLQDYAFFGFENGVQAIKASFVSVALWWALFSIPLLLFVKETRNENAKRANTFKDGYLRLKNTFVKVKKLKGLLLFLVAYWLYIDGVDTIIRMAIDYGMALEFETEDLILALLLVQFVGFPATLLFAKLAQVWDTKKSIFLAIGIYLFILFWAVRMSESYEFYILAFMIALVQGGIQALSRSYYSKMIPKSHAAEFFGFYNFLGKFAAILGPTLVGFVALFTHDSRIAMASIGIFFIMGGTLLYFVNEDKVSREVREGLD
jgi:MFS transporter, UMF1 family